MTAGEADDEVRTLAGDAEPIGESITYFWYFDGLMEVRMKDAHGGRLEREMLKAAAKCPT